MIIDGRSIAKDILARAKARVEKSGRTPRIVVIAANDTPATRSYVSIKRARAADAGCVFEERVFPESVSAAELCSAASSASADAIIVQLPLPQHLDARGVCSAIPLEKDADVLSAQARAVFECGDADALLPPVVAAMHEILLRYSVSVSGKNVVVIGNGWLVGNPCATWLRQQGAEVAVVTLGSGDLSAALRAADIIISGAGSPHLIKPEMLKEGVVLIDAGTSESNGMLAGDADPACAEKCALFTPVPGGIGPIAVAMLFENVVQLSEKTMNM